MRLVAMGVVLLAMACSAGGDPGLEATGGTSMGGAGGSGAGMGGTAGEPPACVRAGASCSNGPTCCADALCVHDADEPELETCAAYCERDEQCASGCCVELANQNPGQLVVKVCAAAEYCTAGCVAQGGDCVSGICCPGSACVIDAVSTTCAAFCASDFDCESRCCAPLNGEPSTRVCSPARFCE